MCRLEGLTRGEYHCVQQKVSVVICKMNNHYFDANEEDFRLLADASSYNTNLLLTPSCQWPTAWQPVVRPHVHDSCARTGGKLLADGVEGSGRMLIAAKTIKVQRQCGDSCRWRIKSVSFPRTCAGFFLGGTSEVAALALNGCYSVSIHHGGDFGSRLGIPMYSI